MEGASLRPRHTPPTPRAAHATAAHAGTVASAAAIPPTPSLLHPLPHPSLTPPYPPPPPTPPHPSLLPSCGQAAGSAHLALRTSLCTKLSHLESFLNDSPQLLCSRLPQLLCALRLAQVIMPAPPAPPAPTLPPPSPLPTHP